MIVVLNLKMHMSLSSVIEYEKIIRNYDVIVLPQYPYLPFFHKGIYSLGAQDVSKYKKGNYTGEVCAKAIKEIGAKYCLVGHSERKKYFNETLIDINQKMENLIENNLIPIMCVTQANEDEGFEILLEQLKAIPSLVEKIIVAYEPEWLIGTDDKLNLENIEKVTSKIKEYLDSKKINYSIIYGGNVNRDNIQDIISLSSIDGIIMSTSARNKEDLEYILNYYN